MFKLVLFISLFLASTALKITLLNLSSFDAIDSYFVAAANRWEEIITSDLSDYYVFSGYWLGEDYSYFDYDGFVDDILIAYDFQTIIDKSIVIKVGVVFSKPIPRKDIVIA
eukprot:CAMPEP_0171478606 /NCGR_PEP_ID=MMETSP0946-20130122/4883_1 /TAXON_ID=109269 /ORGANISM="Vaucheria litorea, Strain CCMP2940" /LENGTH=110 /DNA_ID=CAMNT_0012009285 /DNA_START=717 /DNA_END=1049 /DNA_ORIENTATION=-